MLDSLERIENDFGGYNKFLKAYEEYGIHVNLDNSINCTEWAPGAQQLFLTGEFSKYIYFCMYYFFENSSYDY